MNLKDLMALTQVIEESINVNETINLGDNWYFQLLDDGCAIYLDFKERLSGLRVIWDEEIEELYVSQFINGVEGMIYTVSEYKTRQLKDLSELHYGVAEKLKHTFSFLKSNNFNSFY